MPSARHNSHLLFVILTISLIIVLCIPQVFSPRALAQDEELTQFVHTSNGPSSLMNPDGSSYREGTISYFASVLGFGDSPNVVQDILYDLPPIHFQDCRGIVAILVISRLFDTDSELRRLARREENCVTPESRFSTDFWTVTERPSYIAA